MKNITVSVDDDVYRQARIRAAEQGTSVSALVREFLTGLSEGESEFDRRKQLQNTVLASIKTFRGGSRLPRTAVHDRHALR